MKKVLILILYLVLSNLNDEFEVIMNILKDIKTIDAILMQNNHFIIYKSIKLNLY